MKKAFTFGILPIILGAVAAIFRARELAFGFDFASGLPNGTVNTTPILLVLAGVMLVAVIALTFKKKPEVLDAKKHIAHTAVSLIGVAVMLALGGYVFWQNQVERDVIMNIFAVVCLLNAFAFAILGLRNLRANANGIYSFLALVPVVWSCVALILVFRERVADPIIADFVFLLFAFICILLFSYAQTGYVYRKKRISVALCTAVIGAYFCVIEVLSPFIAAKLNAEYVLALDFKIILPLALFAVYMPISAICMLSNENDV